MLASAAAMAPIISPNIRVRVPGHFMVGEGSIVDDYCYFSTRVEIGRHCHVAAGCHVGGGSARLFRLGDFSSVSAGVKVWCTSDDFVNDLVMIMPSGLEDVKQHLMSADVDFGRYTAVGSNSVVMPGTVLPEGAVIGALSFVPAGMKLEPWSVYAGAPARFRRSRNKEAVLAQVARVEAHLAASPSGLPP
jgi:acetyltransferase-like isoleucine patch superfamily enzyme